MAGFKHNASDVTISDVGLTTFAQFQVREGASVLSTMFTNSAGGALDQFEIAYSVLGSDVWQVVANATSDFVAATRQWPILGAGEDFTTFPVSTSAALSMYVRGVDFVRFRASCTASSDTVITTSRQVR